jgi:hypothetical protein
MGLERDQTGCFICKSFSIPNDDENKEQRYWNKKEKKQRERTR